MGTHVLRLATGWLAAPGRMAPGLVLIQHLGRNTVALHQVLCLATQAVDRNRLLCARREFW